MPEALQSREIAFSEDDNAIPVTLLTGFLGSGKTTLLNHLLNSNTDLKVGVIVNEFGSISIDDKLISGRFENLIKLANGCVCCAMQGDLVQALHDICTAESEFDCILVETTGLADPLPISQLLIDQEYSQLVKLDGIVTVVDALNFDANLDHAEVAFSQLVCADIILLNKVDLVEDEIPKLIEKGVRHINRFSEVIPCINGNVDTDILLGIGISRLIQQNSNQTGSTNAKAHSHGTHSHDVSDFNSVSFEYDGGIDETLFQAFIANIPAGIIRGKGILNVENSDCRHIFHLVGRRCDVTFGHPWAQDEERKSDLVFIGRNLSESQLADGLAACLA